MKKNIFITLFVIFTLISCSKEKNKIEIGAENTNTRAFNMIYVEGGDFMMGNKKEDDTFPHKVSLSDFYISDIEVTQELYSRIMKNNPSSLKYLGKNKPVILKLMVTGYQQKLSGNLLQEVEKKLMDMNTVDVLSINWMITVGVQ